MLPSIQGYGVNVARRSSQDDAVSTLRRHQEGDRPNLLQQGLESGRDSGRQAPSTRVTQLSLLFSLANPRTKCPAPAAARKRGQYRRASPSSLDVSYHGLAHLQAVRVTVKKAKLLR